MVQISRPSGLTAVGRLLELFALTGFAIAQPLLAAFGASPGTFIFRDATPTDIILFAAFLVVLPSLCLWGMEMVAGVISTAFRDLIHMVVVGGLVALVVLQAAKQAADIRGVALLLIVVATGIGGIAIYVAWASARLFLRVSSIAPVLFVGIFLTSSSISPLLSSSGQVASPSGTARHVPSVVVVVFDEWPTTSIVGADGTIDRDLYPNLAGFADTATWYRNATSVSNSTRYAVPAILTGRLQRSDLLPVASSQPRNLFSLFAPTHQVEASESVTGLCPRTTCRTQMRAGTSGLAGLVGDAGDAFRARISLNDSHTDVSTEFVEATTKPVTRRSFDALASRQQVLARAIVNRPDRFVKFLEGFKAHEAPTLHFIHLLLPHVPLRFLPSGLQYAAPAPEIGRQGDIWTDGTWPVALSHQRAILQTMYLDRLVGQLVERLRATRLFDRSVITITADHGIAYRAGAPSRALSDVVLSPSLYPQLLWAPLIVKASNQAGARVNDTNVMSIDVLPTVARLGHVPLRWKVDGVAAGTRRNDTKLFQRAYSDSVGGRLDPTQRFDGGGGFASMLAGGVTTVLEPGHPRWRPWRARPNGSMVGRSISQLVVGAPSTIRASLAQRDDLRHVDATTGTIPAMVWGTASQAATIAIGVNGTIAGMSPTFTSTTPLRFAAMIPERLVHSRANRVELFEVTGPAAQPVFHPIADAPGSG